MSAVTLENCVVQGMTIGGMPVIELIQAYQRQKERTGAHARLAR